MAGENYWGSRGGGYPMKKPSKDESTEQRMDEMEDRRVQLANTVPVMTAGRNPDVRKYRKTAGGWVRRDTELTAEQARQINAHIKNFD